MQPTRITSHSNTLIDNIFSNVIEPDIISGNLTATISDHMHQFAIIPNIFGNISQAININISLKTVASNLPTVLSLDNGDTITSPYDIANSYINYFASITETLKKKKYSHKHF